MAKGNISVNSENIFPIIKQWLYSDKDIFLREIVSNAIDATQKLKTLYEKGEFKGELGDLKVTVTLKDDAIVVSDNGIGLTVEEMAQRTGLSVEEYMAHESGSKNLSIAFLYRCVLILGVDMSDLLEGHSPKLQSFALTRKGEGQRIEEAHHMVGYSLAADFKNRIALPLYMELAYREGAEYEDIELTTHEGQECDIVIRGHMRIQIGERVVSTNLVGSYNADNVMAALAVGQHFGVSFEDAVAAIEAYVPSNNRSQMTATERNTLIVDAYNANPTSMRASIENFAQLKMPGKVLMLGDMLELGVDSVHEHVNVVRKLLTMDLAQIYLVGADFASALAQINGNLDKIQHFSNSDELAERLSEIKVEDSIVLIKGSRGTRMEKVVEKL